MFKRFTNFGSLKRPKTLEIKPYVPPPPPPLGSFPAQPITIAIIGAGARGKGYAWFSQLFPEWMKVVAVAEPLELRRNKLAEDYEIPAENVVSDWKEFASRPKFCDAVFISTLDHMHCEPAIAFADLKYHIMLEKPMAPTPEECRAIVEAAERNNIIFAVGHVLRYTSLNRRIKAIIDSGVLGEIIHIDHLNPVGYWHYAHSYVRGRWHSEKETSFLLMTKSCHDIDLINWWMGSSCTKISSFGSLIHFKKEKKPIEAGDANRCLSCKHAPKCPYDAKRIYLDPVVQRGSEHWPISAIVDVVDIENVTDALQNGPYGRCVYESDNDVVDHQVVNMQFESGATVAFSLVATTEALDARKTTVFGSLGQIECNMAKGEIVHSNYVTKEQQSIFPKNDPGNIADSGHDGGDFGLVYAFLNAIWKSSPTGSAKQPSSTVEASASAAVSDTPESVDDYDPEAWKKYLPAPRETLMSHLYVFAAEHARKQERIVDVVKEFVNVSS